jgi:hypothetical protein
MPSSSLGQESLARYEPRLVLISAIAVPFIRSAIEMSAMSRITPATIALGRLGIDFELVVYDHDAADQ